MKLKNELEFELKIHSNINLNGNFEYKFEVKGPEYEMWDEIKINENWW